MSDISDTDFLNLATPPAIDDDPPGSLPHPRYDPEQVSVPPANRVYIPPSLADANPYRDDLLLEERPAITREPARPGIPLIATTAYPGRLVDARTIVLAPGPPTLLQELVGYRGGAPSPGVSITLTQYVDANPTGVVEVLAEGFEASSQLGFFLPQQPGTITLPISKAMLRLNNVGTGSFVRVGVLIVATDREP